MSIGSTIFMTKEFCPANKLSKIQMQELRTLTLSGLCEPNTHNEILVGFSQCE